MKLSESLHLLPLLLILLLSACAAPTPQSMAFTAAPSKAAPTHLPAMPPTYTPTPSPTPLPPTATPLPSSTPTLEPTLAATPITPIATGPSVGAYSWSPNSRWLPYLDFKALTLHFYDAAKSSSCDFSFPIAAPNPDRFLAWLPDGRVVVQAADKVLAGLPCGTFIPATASEIHLLDHQDPSFSPGGRYQVVVQPYKGSSPGINSVIVLKDVPSGKNLQETAFMDLPRGGGNLPGYWLDPTHYLIPATGDQGPLLLAPDKPALKIAAEFFHLPLKPGSGPYDVWQAVSAITTNPPRFHLMLVGITGVSVTNPLQIYHSETRQVETLPYFAAEGTFTNDGRSLLVTSTSGQAQTSTTIRPLDPPGAPFEPFTDQTNLLYTWSPDGSKAFGMSNLADQQSVISLYASPKRTFLSAWRAPGYTLYPFWSPDGKSLAITARLDADPNQEALFVIRLPEK